MKWREESVEGLCDRSIAAREIEKVHNIGKGKVEAS